MPDSPNENAEKFIREVLRSTKKFECSPALLIYHPKGTPRDVFTGAHLGGPTAEWAFLAAKAQLANVKRWIQSGNLPRHPGSLDKELDEIMGINKIPDIPGTNGIPDLSRIPRPPQA